MEPHEQISLRSEEVQEILGTPPSWMVRFGTLVAGIVLLMLGIVSWVVEYPDTIKAPVSLTTTTPPVSVVARSSGYVSRLLVHDGQMVKKGDILMLLQNPAEYADVMKLDSALDKLQSYDVAVLSGYTADRNLRLGEMQPLYASFVQLFQEYNFKVARNFDRQSIGQLGNQKGTVRKSIAQDRDNQRLAQQKLDLERKAFDRAKQMYADKSVSQQDLEAARSRVLELERQVKEYNSNITTKELSLNELDKQVLEVQQGASEGRYGNYVRLISAISSLRGKIDEWKQAYLLTAPIDGTVSFFNDVWSEQQNVNANDEVLAIVPDAKQNMLGKLRMPLAGSGKVQEGQRVILRFDSYPYQQYGTVEGIVEKKALLPKDQSFYSITVTLPNGLKTSTGFVLRFDQQMQGTAEVITENRRFIVRVFEKIIAAVRNK